MKKILLMCALFCSVTLAANAQVVTAPLGKVQDEVGMSKEQYASYKAIREQNKQATAALDADSTMDVKAKKAKKKELMNQRETATLGLLDDAQKQKYQAFEEKRKAMKQAEKKANEAAGTPATEGAK